MKNKIKKIVIPLVLLLITQNIFGRIENVQGLQKQADIYTTQVGRTMSNIANWGYWIYSDGESANHPNGNSGGIYPRGTAGAIYRDGLIWGGKVDTTGDEIGDDIRVGGQTYNTGTVAGRILPDGTGADVNDPKVKVYRVRPDYQDLTWEMVKQDAMEINLFGSLYDVTDAMCDEIITEYEESWNEWPVDFGAPWTDKDGDGLYNPNVDIAGIEGADQTIWLVVNDLDRMKTLNLYGSEPIGLELQITIWAYNRPNEKIGQSIFKKYKLINKSGKFIEEMYVSQWSDPDIGDYGDDFCGCDTTLSLGFGYNGNAIDSKYKAFGLVPPAVGYDFLQGPIVPSFGDTAIFDSKKIVDYKNLPMTSFIWFSSGSSISDPILGEYEGSLKWYNMLRGYKPYEDIENPVPWTIGNIESGTPTKFPLSGDPVNDPYSDRVDGNADYFPPGDRRIALNSGPFDFAPGDTQEVVIAVIGGLAGSRLSSLTELKDNSKLAQNIYDSFFTSYPGAPRCPKVKATPFEDNIMLQWGFDSVTVAETENRAHGDYKFEGYNVYQLPKADSKLEDATRIATYDVINNVTLIKSIEDVSGISQFVYQYGSNSGIKRFLHIDRSGLTHERLREGSTYYFAVTAYNYYNEYQKKFYESELDVISVRVQEQLPGDSLSYSVSDTVGAIHSEGEGEGNVEIKVINPTETTGDEYEIYFTDNGDTTEILWNIINTTKDSIVVSKQEIRDNFELDDMPIFDGLQVKVSGPKKGLLKVYETDASDVVVDEGVTAFSEVNIGGASLGSTGYLLSNIVGSVNNTDGSRDWDRYGYWGTDDIIIDFSETSLTWDYLSEEVHFDSTDDSPYYAPFSVYRHTVSGDSYRLFAGFWDTDEDGTWNNNGSDWEGPIYGAPSYEAIYCWQGYDASGNEISYAPVNDATYILDNSLLTSANNTWDGGTGYQQKPMITAMLFTEYLGGPPIGNKVWFITSKPFTKDDKFTFKTMAPTIDDIELAKESAEKINVYPNPYYAHNPEGLGEFVTFTHLPEKANIKIYNLAGIHITTLEHNDATSQFEEWDLTNGQNWLVGSGMYIAYIELPDLDMQKILKFMIVQRKLIVK